MHSPQPGTLMPHLRLLENLKEKTEGTQKMKYWDPRICHDHIHDSAIKMQAFLNQQGLYFQNTQKAYTTQ